MREPSWYHYLRKSLGGFGTKRSASRASAVIDSLSWFAANGCVNFRFGAETGLI
jgi:hypothetical protein